ncbi:MAG: TolC family protein [candidate division Zixibacteria bacterium]|nr:TolC family protein [candidate division Zixibacteria bacterium]
MVRLCSFLLIGLACTILLGSTLSAETETPVRFRVGYFETGLHPVHELLRQEFERQLRILSPEHIEILFVPHGYGNGDWKRDSCQTLARNLSATKGIDLMVTIGPWVVEDLLTAGYAGPILAMRQLDPRAAGFVGADGRPVVDNLTVHFQPDKIESDIVMLARLVPLKKLGLLFFPTDSAEQVAVTNRVERLGQQMGFEMVTTEGYDNNGTYAYFKALNGLPDDVDAVYLGPLWGMDNTKIPAFLGRLSNAGTPAFTWEGKLLIDHGAFATASAYGVVSEARFNALKAIRIARGETPADLPVVFRSGTALAINEETAHLCGINIPSMVREEADILPAPTPEEAEFYDLMTAISRVLSGNPNYLATSDGVTGAAHASRETLAAYLPQIDLTAKAGRLDRNTVANTVEPLSRTQYGADLSLSQTIFSWERIKAIKLASQEKDLSEIDRRRLRLDLEQAVVEAYVALLQAEDLYRIQLRYRQVVEHNLELTAIRFHREDETKLGDFIRWKDERQKAIVRTLAAETQKKTAGIMLSVLFNLPLDQSLRLDTAVVADEKIYRDRDLFEGLLNIPGKLSQFQQSLVNTARSHHPVLQTYLAQMSIQESRLALNRSRYLPNLELRATLSLTDQLEDTPDLSSEHHGTWSVFGTLTLPLFEGTGRIHRRSRLKAELSEMEFQADGAMLELTGKIHSLVGQLISTARALPRSHRSRELAVQNLGLTSDDYESGRIEIAGMLEAYRHALDTEINSITTRGQYLQIMAELIHAVGWSAQEEGHTFHTLFRHELEQVLRE